MVILSVTILLIAIGVKVVYKNDFAVIEGEITLANGSGNVRVSYPAGFDSKSIVISIGMGRTDSNQYLEYGHVASSVIPGVHLTMSDISITAYSVGGAGPTKSVPYKIVLMKI